MSALRVHRTLTDPVDRFQVLGDRCSGTNFVHHLIARNLPELRASGELGWKHGFVDPARVAAPGLLTVIVIRHPLRWVQSIYRAPWEVSRSLLGQGFGHFLRAEWRAAWVKDQPDGTVVEEPIAADCDPATGANFANICRMRSAKIAHMQALANLPCQVAFLPYEAANREPKAMISALAQAIDLAPPAQYRPVTAYKGDRKARYRPAPFEPFPPLDLEFVRAELDLAQEARFGYSLDVVPARDGMRRLDWRYAMGWLRRRV